MKYLRRHHQNGIAAVEFTIVVPVLMLLLAVVAEFGNLFIRYNTLSKSVQNGVRFAVTEVYGTANSDRIVGEDGDPPKDGYAYTEIKNTVIYGNPSGLGDPILDDVSVEVMHENKFVIVKATYLYRPFLSALLDNILSEMTLKSSAVMRVTP
ncbi:pilus assembly protein [Vibrio fluvialis]|uniref:TadE/TadG family type IV pilus assembly protein n=1 Tax=Vibrio fluvialis TaxID=676 RepID=UPI00096BADE3|nr:TadE family protein [Vibrio fluvialis]MBY7975216.1 pilus assembly protein [Vibrio fluvialis]MBY8111066.1 pilus assembly protein [Vibrio fluvialis]MBY8294688.1 pilus assembly protein [Vibrio fluvialis]MBY8311250.1 pilus assembly protein [Vibrio fluvialis]MCE7642087.1 pilus assembly protein [Vibrio fluvialis]